MKSRKMMTIAAALGAPVLLGAMPVAAQVTSVAVADPAEAILSANALNTANTQIATTYKAQIDQVVARQQQLQTQLTAMLKPIDTNNDGQISDAELAVAQNAKNPVLQQYATARQTGEQDIGRISTPITRARLYVIEQIAQKYSAAANSVVANKKIGLLLSAGGVQYAQPSADVTGDIKAELDRTVPSVSIAAPANWQPSQQAVQLLQQYEQAVAAQAAQRGNAPAPAAGAKVPAPTGKKPTGR